MKIIIAGAGAVGTHLAKLFSRERHDITLIDDNPERLEGIGSNFEMLTICDSPSSIETLKRADVGKADLFISIHAGRRFLGRIAQLNAISINYT